MVVDTIKNSSRYEVLHPRFKEAFAFLMRPDLEALADGRVELEGERLFAIIQTYETQPAHEGQLEAHQKYIDIQFIVSGEEFMGYAPLGDQKTVVPYDASKDIVFYEGASELTRYRQGMFAIFFPDDAHLPSRFTDKKTTVRKIVVKVAV